MGKKKKPQIRAKPKSTPPEAKAADAPDDEGDELEGDELGDGDELDDDTSPGPDEKPAEAEAEKVDPAIAQRRLYGR